MALGLLHILLINIFSCHPFNWVNYNLVGGFNPSEKYESQLGWWHSQYMDVPNHQPEYFSKPETRGRANDLPCCSRPWLGMIPLYIHHDSRVRSRREVTLIHPQIQLYASWSMKWRSIIELYIHHTYTYIYIYISYIYHRYIIDISAEPPIFQWWCNHPSDPAPGYCKAESPGVSPRHLPRSPGENLRTKAEHLSEWLPKKHPSTSR